MKELIEKYKDRFYWCETCQSVSIAFICCDNSSCNGGGCEKCSKLKDEIDYLYKNDLLPNREMVPHTREQLEEFSIKIDRLSGYTEDEIKERSIKRQMFQDALEIENKRNKE